MVKISVILPAYNSEKTIGTAVTSVLNQTFKDFELIIINDGSTDSTLKKIRQFKDKRIKIIDLKNNKGTSYATNKGIQKATGKYIAKMDADDICFSDRLEKQLKFFEENDFDLISGLAQTIDQKGQIQGVIGECMTDAEIKVSLMFGCPIVHPAVFTTRKLLLENPYNVNFKRGQDYELWVRLKDKVSFGIMPSVLIKYRLSPTPNNELLNAFVSNQDKGFFKALSYGWPGAKRYLKIKITGLLHGFK